jgi:hypothetical protein
MWAVGPYMLDGGIPSTRYIARFWSLVSDVIDKEKTAIGSNTLLGAPLLNYWDAILRRRPRLLWYSERWCSKRN